jgi:hypothetical protein
MTRLEPLEYVFNFWRRLQLPEGSLVVASKTVVRKGEYVPVGSKGSLIHHRKRGFCEVAFVTPLRATVRMKLDELTLARVWDAAAISPGVALIAARDVEVS